MTDASHAVVSAAISAVISVGTTDADPWPEVMQWLDDAAHEPSGHEMVLATATRFGVPSARVVSLRGVDARGLRFFTHDGSRKTRELRSNAEVAAVFHWPRLRRQLRFDGHVVAVPRDEVVAYFATRPRPAQIAASVSRQGQPTSYATLCAAAEALAASPVDPVPCPADFVGYVLVPRAIELWRGEASRLHRRTCFLRGATGWNANDLAP